MKEIFLQQPELLRKFQWSMDFSRQTNLMDPLTLELLDLASQEVHFRVRDETYRNPYAQQDDQAANWREKEELARQEYRKAAEKKKKKTVTSRGPRMSRAEF